MWPAHRRTSFPSSEAVQILISTLVLALAFTLATGGGWQFFVVALITVGVGFVGHELAHKYSATKFGYNASYKIWPMGLVLALILAFVARLIFAALGAVQIYGPGMSREERGIISLSGPVFNIALAVAFMGLAVLLAGDYHDFFGFGAQINALIALFNCIPFAILDGKKIFDWDKLVWLLVVGVAAALFLMTWF